MKPAYLNTLKDFAEGKKDLREWPSWWQENQSIIEKTEGRTRYLKIKHDWLKGTCQILDHHGLTYELNGEINWSRCKECGELLFSVVPHQTTKDQIIEFARKAIFLDDKEQIEIDGWIHPGTYCPNGCTVILISYRDDLE